MNRFSNLVVAASRQHEDHLNPSDRFPFSYAHSTDHLTGGQDAILKRPDTDPLVIHTQTASEYWHRRGSLVHTDTAGGDLPQPEGVRIHLWSSSQHWSDTRAAPPVAGHCRELQNNVVTDPFFAGTLAMMHRWIALAEAPPPSCIPTRAAGTLVSVSDYRARWPAVPGAILPHSANRLFAVDYGPDFDLGAAPQVPPTVDRCAEYAVLVPAPDAYGNDAAGLRAPMVEVPLGTYTGWSTRRHGHGHGALFSFMGSYFPFPETPEEAEITGDPRPAITRLFPTPDDYANAVAACVARLQQQGFIDASGAEKYRRLAVSYGATTHVHRL